MEKFSAFRDPGTGIQPFLKPVPSIGTDVLANVLLPVGYVLGALRTLLVLALGLIYFVLAEVLCLFLVHIPIFHRWIKYTITAILARLALALVGLLWIPVETVTRTRGRGVKIEKWHPEAGDVIVSNWASWIEILWLAFRFDPTFVIPVYRDKDLEKIPAPSATPVSSPGRRTGTGSAAISAPSTKKPTLRAPIAGWREASLLSMLYQTGRPPVPAEGRSSDTKTLEQIRSRAKRPVVVFPECTTSNGRGLLRFAEVFRGVGVPVRKFRVFVMCVRYDPPTALSPSLSHSIPSSILNPLPHMFELATSLTPHTMSVRLLNPPDGPSSELFMASEYLQGVNTDDALSEVCAALVAQLGKVKRTGMGWEDKVEFLEFYKRSRR